MGHDDGAVARRTFVAGALAGLAAAGLGGCQGRRWYPSEMSPDEYVLRGVITEKERMIARYENTLAAGDGPADLLERLLGQHREHLRALRDRLPERDGEPPEHVGPTPTATPESVPETAVSVPALRSGEESAAGARGRQLARLSDPGLSQLIASIGACEIGHAHQLSEA